MDNQTRRMVRALERLTAGRLEERYVDAFGKRPRLIHRRYLIRRLAWRIQSEAEGGLSERALHRAREIANEYGLCISAPAEAGAASVSGAIRRNRLLTPGTILVRPYKGGTLEVTVLEKGFRFEGEVYSSLTALVQRITGASWSGYEFFGLTRRKRGR